MALWFGSTLRNYSQCDIVSQCCHEYRLANVVLVVFRDMNQVHLNEPSVRERLERVMKEYERMPPNMSALHGALDGNRMIR